MIIKSILKNTFVAVISIVVSIIVSYVSTPIIINGLGMNTYGIYITINSILGVFSVADFGSGKAVAKLVSDNLDGDKEYANGIITTSLVFIFIISLVVILINICLCSNLDLFTSELENIKLIYIVMALNFSINFIVNFVSSIFIGFNKINLTYYVNIVKNIIYMSSLYIIINNFNIINFSFIQLILGCIMLCIAILILIHLMSKNNLKLKGIRFKYIKPALKPSLYLFITQVACVVVFNSDNLVISYFLDSESVGLYSTIYKVTALLLQFSFLLPDILFPILLRQAKYPNIDDMFYKFTLILAVYFMAINSIFGNDILRVWIGSNNKYDNNLILIFSIILFLHTVSHMVSIKLLSNFNHKKSAIIAVFECIANIIISIFLVNKLGIIGVALGTLIAHCITTFWYMIYKLFQFMNFSLKKSFRFIISPILISILICMFYQIYIKNTMINVTSLFELLKQLIIFSIMFVIIIILTNLKDFIYKSDK